MWVNILPFCVLPDCSYPLPPSDTRTTKMPMTCCFVINVIGGIYPHSLPDTCVCWMWYHFLFCLTPSLSLLISQKRDFVQLIMCKLTKSLRIRSYVYTQTYSSSTDLWILRLRKPFRFWGGKTVSLFTSLSNSVSSHVITDIHVPSVKLRTQHPSGRILANLKSLNDLLQSCLWHSQCLFV